MVGGVGVAVGGEARGGGRGESVLPGAGRLEGAVPRRREPRRAAGKRGSVMGEPGLLCLTLARPSTFPRWFGTSREGRCCRHCSQSSVCVAEGLSHRQTDYAWQMGFLLPTDIGQNLRRGIFWCTGLVVTDISITLTFLSREMKWKQLCLFWEEYSSPQPPK
ncbi:hypothetical protein FKM82_011722 [Ascaphus truei]